MVRKIVQCQPGGDVDDDDESCQLRVSKCVGSDECWRLGTVVRGRKGVEIAVNRILIFLGFASGTFDNNTMIPRPYAGITYPH